MTPISVTIYWKCAACGSTEFVVEVLHDKFVCCAKCGKVQGIMRCIA